jgi:hypothetical protein
MMIGSEPQKGGREAEVLAAEPFPLPITIRKTK